MKSFRFFAFLMTLFTSLAFVVYRSPTVHLALDTAEIDSLVESVMHSYNMPGLALVVVERDQIIHIQGYGRTDSNGGGMTSHTPMTIGSVSKSFTALAIMQLHERGKVILDEPVVTYLPWFHTSEKARSDQITIRQLLNQTSGLSNAVGLESVYDRRTDFTLEQRLGRLAEYDLTRPAGGRFEYSNTNYMLLGAVVESASGLSYADYMKQNVFDPLDMPNSTALLSEARTKGMSCAYYWWFGLPFPAETPWYQDSVPAGYIISTAGDMGHYLIAQLNGGRYLGNTVLSPEGIANMQLGAVETGDGQSYGMGWVVGHVGDLPAVYHQGDAAGYTSTVILDPDQKIGVAVLANASSMLVSPTNTLATQIYQSLQGQTPSQPGLTTMTLYLVVDLLVVGLTTWMIMAYIYMPHWWKRLGEWRQKGAGTRLTRIFLPIVMDLLWPYILLGFIPQGAGFPVWRVLNVFQPDLSYWLQIFAWAAFAKGLLKMSLFFIFIRTHKPPSIARAFHRDQPKL